MRVAVVSPDFLLSGPLYGAQRHIVGLVEALQKLVDTTWLRMPVDERTWDDLLRSYVDCFDLNVAQYEMVISTKAPTFMVQHPNHVCWLLHQVRVFYDRFDDEYSGLGQATKKEMEARRELVHRLDSLAFGRIRTIFANGHETAQRLRKYNAFESEVLHPPLFSQALACRGQNYLLLPGRLHRWKRVDLAIRALKLLPDSIPLLIPGTGEDEPYFRKVGGDDERIRFLGYVSDEQLAELYADALAVLFIPKEEDFGYVALEAMMSRKPVITCADSGEPSRLVQDGVTGFVVRPEVEEIAAAIRLLVHDRALARELGENGFRSAPRHSWEDVARRLLAAGKPGAGRVVSVPAQNVAEERRVKLLVCDNQVLDPPVGGGRLRIYQLYRHLSSLNFEVKYIGAYDWPGPAYREQYLSPHFREIVTPLTQPHFRLNGWIQRLVGGKTVIDVTTPRLLRCSPRFHRLAREHGEDSSVIVISHPWVYPCVPHRQDQLLIYDAHNCEFVVKNQILSDTLVGKRLVADVKRLEGELCRAADLIFACSSEDAAKFVELYGIERRKITLVPNGVDVEEIQPGSGPDQQVAKKRLGLPPDDRPLLVFVGSGYLPNWEAASFITRNLAPLFPECQFFIVGSVSDFGGAKPQRSEISPTNVRWTGVVDNTRKLLLYRAADIALNPMFSGSGTNMKMLDYFAAGLPVVSTPAGVRGLELTGEECIICPPEGFASKLRILLDDREQRRELGQRARELAVQLYSWTFIAEAAARTIHEALATRGLAEQTENAATWIA